MLCAFATRVFVRIAVTTGPRWSRSLAMRHNMRRLTVTEVQADTSGEKIPEAPPAPAEEMVAAPPAGDPVPLGLLVTTVWAAALGQTFVATVLGAFACFWISYAALVLGLAHNWYGIPPTAILHTIGQFLIAWDIVIFMLFLVSLRIPLLFSLILGAGVVGV